MHTGAPLYLYFCICANISNTGAVVFGRQGDHVDVSDWRCSLDSQEMSSIHSLSPSPNWGSWVPFSDDTVPRILTILGPCSKKYSIFQGSSFVWHQNYIQWSRQRLTNLGRILVCYLSLRDCSGYYWCAAHVLLSPSISAPARLTSNCQHLYGFTWGLSLAAEPTGLCPVGSVKEWTLAMKRSSINDQR